MATTIEIMFRDQLIDDTTVSGIVGTKVAPILVSQKYSLPYVTFQLIDGSPLDHLTGVTKTWNVHFQVNCITETYAGSKTLADATRGALNGWSDESEARTGIVVTMCRLDNEIDDMDNPDDASAKGVYRVIQTYSVWYREALR